MCTVSDIRHTICLLHTSVLTSMGCHWCQVGRARFAHRRSHFSDQVLLRKRPSWRSSLFPAMIIAQKSHDVSTVSWFIYFSFGDGSIYFVEINIFNIQLKIFPVFPAHYTPKVGFSRHFLVKMGCTLFTNAHNTRNNTGSIDGPRAKLGQSFIFCCHLVQFVWLNIEVISIYYINNLKMYAHFYKVRINS